MRDGVGHGDWIKDEVDLTRKDTLLHGVTLSNGSFEIEADTIEYTWTPLLSPSGV
jgi:hypothetical protein